MSEMFEIYDNYKELGILTRKITMGKEYELVRQFIDFRKNIYNSSENKNMAIFLEPKVNNSYPDIVFVEYCPSNYENWESVRNGLSVRELKILYHIYVKRCISAKEIVSQLGVTWKDTMLSIEKLYDSKLILRKNYGWCIRSKKSISLSKIEAVEAKLDKLNDVFQQALINKTFASESYILSKRSANFSHNRMELFDKFGIGVYVKDKNGFETIKKSKEAPIPVSFNSIYFNEWIGRILNNEGGSDVIGIERPN